MLKNLALFCVKNHTLIQSLLAQVSSHQPTKLYVYTHNIVFESLLYTLCEVCERERERECVCVSLCVCVCVCVCGEGGGVSLTKH